MKKSILLLLCALMVVSCFLASCNQTEETSKPEGENSNVEAGYDPESGKYVANLIVLKYIMFQKEHK